MQIELKGRREGTVVEFDKSRHVQLSDGYYEKSDKENVVNVEGRYFRKNSPLVTLLDQGPYEKNPMYVLSDDVVVDSLSGFNLYRGDSDPCRGDISTYNSKGEADRVVKRGSPIYYKTNTYTFFTFVNYGVKEGFVQPVVKIVDLNSLNNLLNSGVAIRDPQSDILLDSEYCVKLHDSYSRLMNNPITFPRRGFRGLSPNSIGRPKERSSLMINDVVADPEGFYHFIRDIVWSYDNLGNKYKMIKNMSTGYLIDKRANPYSKVTSIDSVIKDQMVRAYKNNDLALANAVLKSKINVDSNVDSDFDTNDSFVSELGIISTNEKDALLVSKFESFVFRSALSKESVNKKIAASVWFKELHQEPIPGIMTGTSIGDQGGDFIYFSGGKKNIDSSSFNQTGGLKYTFGVELETQRGVVPYSLVERMGVDAVGDRSIGSLEYVTGVLRGDEGISFLKELAKSISNWAFVSDRCGVHVHVGGAKFDKRFSLMAVMLGSQIENDMFSILPDNRTERVNSNGQSYCSKISGEYGDISKKNWKKKLFHYVYGRNPEDSSEEFGGLDSMIERRHRVGRWAQGRYKWLNLVNCLTDNSGRRNGGGFQTIEFRHYNGTLNSTDIEMFVLMSLAFVSFVENNQKDIEKGGCTLNGVIKSTMDHQTANKLISWIESRKSLIQAVRNRTKQIS